jgi:hypothetical protein
MAGAAVLALQWPPVWGWAVAIVIVVLGGIIVTSVAGPHLAAVGVTPDDRLLVRPVGLMRVWALTKGIDVPVTSILDVGVHERRGLLRGFIGWRTPGTYLPGFMVAGTYRSKGEKDLWMVGRARHVLVIELTGEAYRRVVVQVEDPEAATEALRAAMTRER